MHSPIDKLLAETNYDPTATVAGKISASRRPFW